MLTRLLRNRGDDMSTKIISAEKIESAKSAIKNAVDKANKAGYSKGFESGKQEEYNNFWNSALSNGEQEYFAYAFGSVFNKNNFKPNHKMIPKSKIACKNCVNNKGDTCAKYGSFPTIDNNNAVAEGMFQGSRIVSKIDASMVDWYCVPCMLQTFMSSQITEITGLNPTNCTNMTRAFKWAGSLKKIQFLGYGKVAYWKDAFYSCEALKDVILEPVLDEFGNRVEFIIGSINFGDCINLTRESIESILAALSDDVAGKTITFSLSAVNKAFESTNGANDGSTNSGWLKISTKNQNWRVILI